LSLGLGLSLEAWNLGLGYLSLDYITALFNYNGIMNADIKKF